jgi:hypothetical protein
MRTILATILTLGAVPALAEPIEVMKTPTCGCCGAWVEHMAANGFEPTVKDMPHGMLNQVKARLGITPATASCHTAIVEGYVIEGHVPASDVERLLAERPEAIGLAVPGMPIGSPGMEMGDEREIYDVVLIRPDGTTEVFATHGAN